MNETRDVGMGVPAAARLHGISRVEGWRRARSGEWPVIGRAGRVLLIDRAWVAQQVGARACEGWIDELTGEPAEAVA